MMTREDFTLNSGQADGKIPCTLLSHESKSSTKSLLVVPSVFGVDATLLQHCKRFVEHDFRVFALDSFWRDCPGPLIPDEEGMKKAMGRMASLSDVNCDNDVSALANYIRTQHPSEPIIALGICFGGRPVMRAAVDGEVNGVAAWHGVRIGELSEQLGKISCPMSLQFGSIDAWTPAEEIAAVRSATEHLADVDIQVHADCDHGFTHIGRDVFNQAAYDASITGLLAL